MRPLHAIAAAACLIVFALPVASRADGPAPGEPGCHCPRPVRHVVRRVRHVVRRWRAAPAPMAYAPPPVPETYYNPLLPSTWDTDYDRAMVLHFRSPPVAGIYFPDPGYTATPDVAGVAPYKQPAYGTVYQYDGLTGEYIALAQADAVHALPPAPPAPPPVPPAAAPASGAAPAGYTPQPPPPTPLPLVPR